MSKKKIILSEMFGQVFVLIFVWLNGIIDILHTVFRIAKIPVNITESILESVVVITVAIITISISSKLLKKKQLESFLKYVTNVKNI